MTADAQLSIPDPPYEYEAVYISRLFLVPPRMVEPLLPEPLLPYCFFSRAFFEIMIVKYSSAISMADPDTNFAYNEIGFGVHCLFRPPCSKTATHGVHYKLMYLDNDLGIQTGRVHYGFPKEYASIRIYEDTRANGNHYSVEVVIEDRPVLQGANDQGG